MRMLRYALLAVLAIGFLAVSLPLRAQDDPAEPKFNKTKTLKLLTSRDEAERMEGLQTVLSGGDAAVAAELISEALDKSIELKREAQLRDSTTSMMMKLGEIKDSKALEALTGYLDAENYRFGMTAAEALKLRRDEAALPFYFEMAKHRTFNKHFWEIYGFRRTVVHAVLAVNSPRAVDWAIKLLPHVTGNVRFDVLRWLITLTDQDFGNNQDAWKTWWEDNQEDFQFANTPDSLDLDSTAEISIEGLEVPTYYDVKIYAKRVVFVLDISSSMVEDGPAPPNDRLTAAKTELVKTLGKLPDGLNFAILAFNGAIKPYAGGKMIEANEKSREAAIKWVSYIRAGKGTNSHGALMRAFTADGNTESIMFLSDGKPSRGQITDPNLILAEVKKENKFRKLIIHAVGVFTGGEQNGALVNFMQNLAGQNNGVYRQVN